MAETVERLVAGRYRSLEEMVAASGPLPPRRVATIGLDLLDTLRAAHAAGTVHLGVQPRNVAASDRQAVLNDSDITNGDGEGATAFTAPEVARGAAATAAADLWSLGATLFYAAVGRWPAEAASLGASSGAIVAGAVVADAIVADAPGSPGNAGLLASAIEGLLHDDPARRLGVDEASHLLTRVLRGGAAGGELARPQQLPATAQGFVGRTEQLETMTRLLDEPFGPVRPVVHAIVGAAGVGKTALALRWAQQVHHRFPDGQLYVDLRGYDPGPPVSPRLALEGFLRALGLSREEIPAEVEEQAELYRSLLRGRRVLVVLDNANSAEQASPLLPGSAGCAAVVTSRSQLPDLVAFGDAHPFSLGLLTPAEAIELLAQRAGDARVDAEPGAAAELARLCAHVPLALRVAAERVAVRPATTLADLAEELAGEHERLDAPAADAETTALLAVFFWSYRALPPAAAGVFRLLGVHPGPDISAPATAGLTGLPLAQVPGLLDVLSAAHLLGQTSPDRYRFHDLLRLFAADRAAAAPEPERAVAVRRVLTWYLHSADAAVRVLSPLGLRVPLETPDPDVACAPPTFADQRQALAWCEAERANLVAATRHAAQCGQLAQAWMLPAVLWDFFSLRGHWTDWVTTHDIGLAAAQHAGDKRGEAWMENNLGNAYRGLGQFDEALRHFHRALAINEETCHRRGEGWTRYNIGDTYREQGQFTEALNHLRQALFISREIGERWSEGYTLNMIGETYRGLGQFDEALRCLLPALVINREIGHRRGEGFTLNAIGDTYRERGRYDQAISYYEQALTARREIGDRRGEGLTLHRLGETYHAYRLPEQALPHYEQALAIRREIGDQRGEAQTLSGIGAAQHHSGQLDAARESWRRALAIFDDLGDPQAAQVRASMKPQA